MVTLPGVLMQSVTSIAPAIAGLFTVVYRGDRAGNLALAGAAMGESMEEAIAERYSVNEPVPPPDAMR